MNVGSMKDQSIYTKVVLAFAVVMCFTFALFHLTQSASAEHIFAGIDHVGGISPDDGGSCGSGCVSPDEFTEQYDQGGTQPIGDYSFMQYNCVIVVAVNDCSPAPASGAPAPGGAAPTPSGPTGCVMFGQVWSDCGPITPVEPPPPDGSCDVWTCPPPSCDPSVCTPWPICDPTTSVCTPPPIPPAVITTPPLTCVATDVSTMLGEPVRPQVTVSNPADKNQPIGQLTITVNGIPALVDTSSKPVVPKGASRIYGFRVTPFADDFDPDSSHAIVWTVNSADGINNCQGTLNIEPLFSS